MELKEIIDKAKLFYCLDCGVCSGSCPVSRTPIEYSPRLQVGKLLLSVDLGMEEEALKDPDIWRCLTCGQCLQRCPQKVDYLEFIKDIREEAVKAGSKADYSHHGILQAIMEIQNLGVNQNKTAWAKESGNIAQEGEYYFFTGCLPFFDPVFKDLNVSSLNIAGNMLKIINKIGIAPVVSDEERCCGHDMMWNGEIDSFKKLAAFNIELIRRKGSKKVIFACPEGYSIFKKYYPVYFGELGFEVIHFYDFILDKVKGGELKLPSLEGTLTYHDPCRLGRFSGIYETPREIIASIPGVTFVEMDRNREKALCCGTTGWAGCSTCSKQIQIDRLNEAKATGANILITACPKCRIHLTCALIGSDLKIEIKDLSDLLAMALV